MKKSALSSTGDSGYSIEVLDPIDFICSGKL